MTDLDLGKEAGFAAGWNGIWYPDLRAMSADFRNGFALGYTVGMGIE